MDVVPYSEEQIKGLADDFQKWDAAADKLTTAILVVPYSKPAARTMAAHGFARRLIAQRYLIKRVYNLISPAATDPGHDDLMDATAFIQTFMFSTYACLDNLARIWCIETELKTKKGKPLTPMMIGLGPAQDVVRKSLSQSFQEKLEAAKDWFSYIENYRHALAHRVPLYIPPRTLGDSQGEEWNRLRAEMDKASAEHRYEDWNRLSAECDALGTFEALIMHSFGTDGTDGRPVRFHGQMICDLATVVDFGEAMVAELRARTGQK